MDSGFYLFLVQPLLLLSIFPFSCLSTDIIEHGFPLMDGETLVSAGEGMFELGFFTPYGSLSGNKYLGIWNRLSPQIVVWVANREKPVPSSGQGFFGINDNNLQVWDGIEEASLWSSEIGTSGDVSTAKLMDSGNLVLGNSEWESFRNPTDTFLPGMKMQTDLQLTSWKTKDDPSGGSFTFKLDDQGRYVIKNKSETYWRSGGRFAMSDMLANMLSNTKVAGNNSGYKPLVRSRDNNGTRPVMNSNGTIEYKPLGRSRDNNGTRLVMNSNGTIEYRSKSDAVIWSAPEDRCSVVAACGQYGVCNAGGARMCECLPGFTQVYGDFSGGCQRAAAEKCDDNFVTLKWMDLRSPESGESQVANETECKKSCLESCKCNAYSFRAGSNRRFNNTCLIWSEPLSDLQRDLRRGSNLSVRVQLQDLGPINNCESCGTVVIPYPLSTQPDCGDPMYFSFRCNGSDESLTFKALDGDYRVVSFDVSARKFTVQVVNGQSEGFGSKALQVNQTSPFRVTDRCKGSSFQGSSPTACQVEIQWEPPPEPVCSSVTDCDKLPNTSCGPAKYDARNRCLCKTGYKWDSLILACVHSQGSSFPLVAVITILSALALLCASTWLIIWRMKLNKQERKRSDQRSKDLLKLDTQNRIKHYMNPDEFEEEDGEGIDVPFFDFDTIVAATDGFSDYNKLGQGGYGPVYKGMFQGGQEIAVKRLSSISVQGLEEFKNEVVLIAKLQHRNLVRLRGYCVKGSEKILLYEYMPNRSLDSFIFDEEQGKILDWEKRFNIIVGIARGLLYLHQDSRLRIIHRDLKTSNVLLDREMEPKISDFGLARIFGGKQTEASTERVVGTYGYMSPEYAIEGLFSVKSDVFSFGVVLLEIISGKRNTRVVQLAGRPLSLLGYAWRLWTENRELELVDPTVSESCNSEQFTKCVKIALLCVQEDPSERPTMSTVVTMLDSDSANVPDPLQPAFALKTGSTIPSSSSADTRAEITVTLEHGR